ncbi:lipopolysaccharide biosynthesis protein [Agriterribacter sp.]|uniref:lipopolysaccharide biosynthesis protein n=1 Tax=Agriterribacter sp. TaxID=2821509 RepID=UPI002C9B9F16|nr:lipopolysaccharide biosynthesis protein [Agriterribacter sp.]HTN08992.1 lipopolysaccharide biosynthesis protein [Agriterribacter sp.]
MGENLTQKTFKGFYWQFGGAIFKTFIQLGVLFVLARLISKAEFGIMQSSLVVVGFSNLLSQMGVGPALVQKANLTPIHIRVGSTISLILSAVLFLIVFLGSGLIADFFKMPELQNVLKVVAVLFIIEGITTVSQSLLLREMKQKVLVKIDFTSYLMGYGVVAITLSYYGFGLWSLIIGQLMQSLIKCILSFIKCKHSIMPCFSKKETNELLYYGGGFTIARLFNYLALQGDNIVTGRYLGPSALGIYSRAYSIMVKPVSLIGDSIDKALFPAMAARQSQPDRLIEAFINGSKMISFLCIPISCVLIFSSKEIINVLLSSKWSDTIVPLQILTAGLIFRMGYKMGDCLSRATGNVYSRAKRQFIYAFCVIFGCYIGSNWGITGVSYGTLFAVTVNYILMIHLSLNILKINWIYFLKRTFSELHLAILLALLFVAIITLTRQFISSDFMILLLSYGIYGTGVMVLFYFFSNKLSFLDILPFKGVLNKITKKS